MLEDVQMAGLSKLHLELHWSGSDCSSLICSLWNMSRTTTFGDFMDTLGLLHISSFFFFLYIWANLWNFRKEKFIGTYRRYREGHEIYEVLVWKRWSRVGFQFTTSWWFCIAPDQSICCWRDCGLGYGNYYVSCI